MAITSVAGFIYFMLGLLYMDMRVDYRFLIGEPSPEHIRLAYIHYDIEFAVHPWYQYILPILIVAAVAVMIKRVIEWSHTEDWIVIGISAIMAVIFLILKILQQEVHDQQLNIRDFDIFNPSNTDLVTSLKVIAYCHVILIIFCFIQLVLLRKSYDIENFYDKVAGLLDRKHQ